MQLARLLEHRCLSKFERECKMRDMRKLLMDGTGQKILEYAIPMAIHGTPFESDGLVESIAVVCMYEGNCYNVIFDYDLVNDTVESRIHNVAIVDVDASLEIYTNAEGIMRLVDNRDKEDN